MEQCILHIDMDAFFASVEQRDHPQYRGKPVIVGALPGNRGVVCAASYEARAFGVHSAQPISRAYALCPRGIFVAPRMKVYSLVSSEIMAILQSFSPVMEQVSIDEAFLDITGTNALWGDPVATARAITDAVYKQQLLSVSIGVAPNKFLAKIASDMNKPRGITLTPFQTAEIRQWLSELAVGKLMGVGIKTQEAMFRLGLRTIGDVQRCTMDFLQDHFGKQGALFHELCRGMDNRPVESSDSAKSISREHTFDHDTADYGEWKKTILFLASDVARRARLKGLKGNVAVLSYRAEDFTKRSLRMTLPQPIDSGQPLYHAARALLEKAGLQGRMLRLLGVGLTGFATEEQMELFGSAPECGAWMASEKALDAITQKFGTSAIVRGVHVGKNGKRTKIDNNGSSGGKSIF